MNRILDILRRYPVILEAQRNEAARDCMNCENTVEAVGRALTPYINEVPTREACAREVVAERTRQATTAQQAPEPAARRNWSAIGLGVALAMALAFIGFHFLKVSLDHGSAAVTTNPATPPVVTTSPAPTVTPAPAPAPTPVVIPPPPPRMACNRCVADNLLVIPLAEQTTEVNQVVFNSCLQANCQP